MRRWLFDVIALATACLAVGLPLGFLASPPEQSVAVWPPVGLGLAFLWVRGLNRWPGIGIALFITTLILAVRYNPNLSTIELLLSACVAGGLFSLQTVFGAWLLNRVVGPPSGLVRPGEIIKFLLVAGPLHTLPAVVLGAVVYCWSRGWPPFDLSGPWLTWWTNSLAGGLVFAPVTLTLIGVPVEAWRPRRLTVALPLLVATGLTVAGFLSARDVDQKQAIVSLNNDIDLAATGIKANLDRLDGALTDLAEHPRTSLLRSDSAAARSASQSELRTIQQSSPLVGTVWLGQMVRGPNERDRFEESFRKFTPEFRITDAELHGKRLAAEGREQYLAFAASTRYAAFPLGTDLLTIPSVSTAFERSVETGRVAVTSLTAAEPEVILLVVPLYPSVEPDSGADRLHLVRAVVVVALDLPAVTTHLLPGHDPRVTYHLLPPAAASIPSPPPNGEVADRKLSLAGEVWQLRAVVGPEYLADRGTHYATVTCVVGVLLTVLLTAFLLVVTGQTRVVADEVAVRTVELRDEVAVRQAAEVSLRTSESRLEDAQRIARVGSFEAIPGSNSIWWSDELYRLLGYERGEVEPSFEALVRRVHRDDQAEVLARLYAALSRGEPYAFEFRVAHTGGRDRVLSAEGLVTRDEYDRPVLLRGTNQDITERKRGEAALQTSQARLAEAQRIARLGGWEWNLNTGEVWWSAELYQLLGREPSDLPLTFDVIADWMHPDDLRAVQRKIDHALASGERVDDLDSRFRMPNGELRWFRASFQLVREESGRSWLKGVSRDVTDERKVAEARKEFEENLQQTQRLESLGVLAGGVAHDFNNLLTGILGHTTLAREMLPPADQLHQHLRPVEKAAEQAAHLCQQMLAYAGKGGTAFRALDLNKLIQDSDELLELSAGKRATLRIEKAADLPRVTGDQARIRQVLLNLVQNASEAIGSHCGTITVRTGVGVAPTDLTEGRWYGDLPADDAVWFEVIDTGCGMDEVTRDRIFEPFFTTKFTGRGLGLSAVHGIVRDHRGAICVTSAPGLGTTFLVAIPRAAAAQDTVADTNDRDGRATPLPASPYPGSALTALVADDEETVRELAVVVLRALGFEVTQAVTGREAVELIRAEPGRFALALLDVLMPEMDGREALDEVRSLRPDMPVVLMSGYSEYDMQDLPLGPKLHFLPKPFRPADLNGCVRRVIGSVG